MMVSFGNEIDLRMFGKGLYQVLAPVPFMVADPKAAVVVDEIPQGFITDRDSIPRMPFFYMLLKERAEKEAVLHDFLYRIGPVRGYTRKWSDQVLLAAMEQNPDIGWWARQLIYAGVRFGGSAAYELRRQEAIQREEILP